MKHRPKPRKLYVACPSCGETQEKDPDVRTLYNCAKCRAWFQAPDEPAAHVNPTYRSRNR